MIIYPGRTIESDVVLAASTERRVIDKNVSFEDSDHHNLRLANLHITKYQKQQEEESW
jgi:hypothetical protein